MIDLARGTRLSAAWAPACSRPRDIVIEQINARHNDARIELTGKGITDNPNDWDLAVKATGLPADAELRKALPAPLRLLLDDLKYKGNLSMDLKSFRYRGDRDQPDADMAGTLSARPRLGRCGCAGRQDRRRRHVQRRRSRRQACSVSR